MPSKPTHPDQKYIQALLTGEKKTVRIIYDHYAEKISRFVQKNNGTKEDAKDLFQEALTIVYNQGKAGLQLTCPFEAYFYTICKRRWINELKKKSRMEVEITDTLMPVELPNIEADMEHRDRQALYRKYFQKLGESCQQILNLSFGGISMNDVAEQLDISYQYARKRKSECIKKLMGSIKQDCLYLELKTVAI